MFDMAILVNDPGSIPLSGWVQFLRGRCRMHIVVATCLLFITKFALPTGVVKQLIFRTCFIVVLVLRIFDHVVEDTTISTFRKFEIERQIEVAELAGSNERTSHVAASFTKPFAITK